MLAVSSQAVPINPGNLANISRQVFPKPFGAFAGDPGACGCSPVGGCGCNGDDTYSPPTTLHGLRGLGQTTSLDQIISNTFSWLGGTVESNLPASAAVPPSVGSTGALITTLTQWAPYIIGGYLLYKAMK